MKNLNNITNEGLVESKEMRSLVMQDLPSNLAKSPVMEGLQTIIPGIATINNAIDFFNTKQQSILKHSVKEELQEAGAQQVSYKEWHKLLETLKTKSDLVLSNSNDFSNQSHNSLETLKVNSGLTLSNSNDFSNQSHNSLETLKGRSDLPLSNSNDFSNQSHNSLETLKVRSDLTLSNSNDFNNQSHNSLETLKVKSDLTLSNSNDFNNQSHNSLETLKTNSGLVLSNSNDFSKVELEILKSLSTLTEEERQSINFPARGTWLFTLDAVCKLGMLMTDTPKAKEFRDKIITTLKVEVIKTESLEKWHKTTIKTMKDLVNNNKSLNDTMSDFIERLLDDTKLMYKQELLDSKKELVDLLKVIQDRIANKQDNKFQVQISNRNIVDTVIIEIDNVIQELDQTIIDSVNQPGNYKREDALKSLYEKNPEETDGQYTMRIRKTAGVLNNILTEAELITIKEHTKLTKDGKNKVVKKVSANDKNPWVFDSIVGQFGKESQPTFHLTKYGFALWEYLYTQAKQCLDNDIDPKDININKEWFDAQYCFNNK